MIRAVVKKDILWPQKQEDREEGGWKASPTEKQACDPRACDSEIETQISSSLHRRNIGTDETHTNLEKCGHDGPSEPRETEPGITADGSLPVFVETLIDQSLKGRGQTREDDMV